MTFDTIRSQMSRSRMSSHLAAASSSEGVTLWRRVADGLEQAIADGTYPAGCRLPGEVEIAHRFDVNRHTVRRAINALAARGVLRAERGSGTYVEARPITYPIHPRTRFSEIIGSSGREAGGRMIAGSHEAAAREIAHRLAIESGALVIRIDAIRQADRIPICVTTSWLPADRFPEAQRIYAAKRSITKTLAQFGVRDYRRARTRVVAALADAADTMWLQLDPGRAVLIVDSVDVDAKGKPVVTTRARFAAERVEILIER